MKRDHNYNSVSELNIDYIEIVSYFKFDKNHIIFKKNTLRIIYHKTNIGSLQPLF